MGEFIKLMGGPGSLAIWPFFDRELEVIFRHKFAPKAPLYPRDGASRLMFGTPAARRPLLVALYVDLHRPRYRALLKKQIKYHYTNGV